MRRMFVLMGAGVAALSVAGAVAQVVVSATGSPASACTAAEEALATSLGTLPILNARPDGATPRGGRETGCDRDDALVSAGQSYDLPVPRTGVLSFYRDAAQRDGWTRSPDDEGDGTACLVRRIGGRDVHLSVWFIGPEAGRDGDGYHVSATSSLDGAGRC
ncbi:hypothetical protein AAH991_02645 [Microbispora sp. ZYX-F-249]|uniref:Secreted protein n=1 Tax=Microbispora maris TaxID=3144104 RepID=A0ABV0AHH1_9ACTN